MMGILVITWNFPPRRGGIENLIAGLCHELKKTHPLFIITSYVPSTSGGEGSLYRPRWPGILPFFLYSLYRGAMLLRSHPEVKVIVGGSSLVSPVVVVLAKFFRRKSVVHVHGLDLLYPSIPYQLLCLRWLKHYDRVIANSLYTASLAEAKGAQRGTIHVIPPGIYCEFFSSAAAANEKEKMRLASRKVLLFVGRLTRRKGISEFLQRSFVRIIKEIPEAYLLVVGENPSDSLAHHEDIAHEIGRLIGNLRLEDHVRLLGWLSDTDLVKIYHLSDLLVLPALSMKEDVEGFGIVIVEAAAAGRTCVATRVGGIPDAVEDGKSGLLVEPQDYENMSRSIVSLLRNDDTRLTMGIYARKRVREQFSWQSVIERYDAMLRSLAG